MRIGMLIFPGFQLLDVAGPLEIFGATEGLEPMSIAASREPLAPDGWPQVRFTPDADLATAPEFDVLFVPGGDGIRHALRDAATLRFLRERGERAAYVTSVCTGALVIGAAGLLRGYRAATYWRYMDLLPIVGAIPIEARYVRDRNRITSGGVTAGMDFGLALAAELVGEDRAKAAQLKLQYAPAPPFDAGEPSGAPAEIVDRQRAASQARYDERAALLRSIMSESR